MNKLTVKRLQQRPTSAAHISDIFNNEGIEWQPIAHANWADAYPYSPKVSFRIAHTGDAILLEYDVEEDSVRAVAAKDNDSVWEDSCCEFFSQPAGDTMYY